MTTTSTARHYRATAAHASEYPEPITLRQGDRVQVGEAYEGPQGWGNWHLCSIDGQQDGWVPGQIIETLGGGRGRITEDYTARELDVSEGQALHGTRLLNSWLWAARAADGATGWVPLRNLQSIECRPAQLSDVAGIFQVRTSVRENALSMAEMARLGITEASVAAMIEREPCAWVACEGAHTVGFSMIDTEEGSLFAAFVLPSHEGLGIGKRLVQRAEDALFARHAVAWLETACSSRAAGFYRHLGWGQEQDVGEGDIRLEKGRPAVQR